MHSKQVTQTDRNYQKLNKLKNLLQTEMKTDPMPKTNHTQHQKKSLKVYLKQFRCSQNYGYFAQAKWSTLGKRESNSKHLKSFSQTNSTSQIINPKLNSETPNLSPQNGIPSSKDDGLPYNEWANGPPTHHHLYTYNTFMHNVDYLERMQ